MKWIEENIYFVGFSSLGLSSEVYCGFQFFYSGETDYEDSKGISLLDKYARKWQMKLYNFIYTLIRLEFRKRTWSHSGQVSENNCSYY